MIDLTRVLHDTYVYMLNGSTLTYNFCMRSTNTVSVTNMNLYVFADEYAFKDYDAMDNYQPPSSPLFSHELMLGTDGVMACTIVEFSANANGYYFAIVKLPAHITFLYNATARIRHFELHDYDSYSKCHVTNNRNCTVSIPKDTRDYAFMVFMQPEMNAQNTSHLQMTYQPRFTGIMIGGIAMITSALLTPVCCLLCCCFGCVDCLSQIFCSSYELPECCSCLFITAIVVFNFVAFAAAIAFSVAIFILPL